MVEKRSQKSSVKFLKMLIDFFPYPIHRILTDNGTEFTYRGMLQDKRPRYQSGKEKPHPFTLTCKRNKIKHKMTKFRHPWAYGQVNGSTVVSKAKRSLRLTIPATKPKKKTSPAGKTNTTLRTKLRSIKKLTPYEKVVEYFKEHPESFSRRLKKSQFCTTNW